MFKVFPTHAGHLFQAVVYEHEHVAIDFLVADEAADAEPAGFPAIVLRAQRFEVQLFNNRRPCPVHFRLLIPGRAGFDPRLAPAATLPSHSALN
jgi:hypothetical protein